MIEVQQPTTYLARSVWHSCLHAFPARRDKILDEGNQEGITSEKRRRNNPAVLEPRPEPHPMRVTEGEDGMISGVVGVRESDGVVSVNVDVVGFGGFDTGSDLTTDTMTTMRMMTAAIALMRMMMSPFLVFQNGKRTGRRGRSSSLSTEGGGCELCGGRFNRLTS